MISVHEHQQRILGAVAPVAPRELSLLDARGCVLTQDVHSRVGLPGFDNSAMDGYAVRASDVAAASASREVRLPVDGDIAAGDGRALELAPGHAFRIMTGAPVPAGADTIVPVEATDGGSDEVTIHEGTPEGRHIRRAATDVREGDVVLTAGTRLGPRQLGLAAAVGHGSVPVRPRPRVAVVSTGDELVAPGTTPGHGQVVDSNGVTLVTALLDDGFDAHLVSGVRDTEDEVLAVLRREAERSDAIVTTGGVSMGVYDAVKAALSRLGSVEFVKVAMQPGKPQGFGEIGSVPAFTLPGNPVSAFVSLHVFVLPALRVMAGRSPHEARLVRAVVEEGWHSPEGKTQFARGVLARTSTHHVVRSAGGQGSHMLGALADANCLVVVPPDTTRVVAGIELLCLPLGPIPFADGGAS